MTCDDVELCERIVASPEPAPRAYPRPDYSKKFRCLAQDCDENCCNGWTIPIDQRTLESYRQHPTLKPFVSALVVLNTQSPDAGHAASMPLTHHGTCAFLNNEKLCSIHAHFGPDILPNACSTYPREVSYHLGQAEAALNLSCPEAARLTLLDSTLLGSGPWQAYGPRRYSHLSHATRLPAAFDPLLALREVAILVITDPTYPLWQRMHILGDLARRLEALADGSSVPQVSQSDPVAVAALLDQVVDAAAFHTFSFPSIDPDPAAPLRFTAEILRVRLLEPAVPAAFLAHIRTFQAGLGCDLAGANPLTNDQITQNFRSTYRHHVRPLLDRHPNLIENFLINQIFKYDFPFGRSRNGEAPATPVEQHLTLVASLCITQTLLVGLAAQHRDRLTTAHVVQLIQSLAKAIEHRPASAAHLPRLLHERNLTTPAAQAQLLHLA